MLHEKRLDWNGHYLDILRGDQFDPDYLKLNPKGVVPTLLDDGTVIRESTVICEYLDEVFPEPALRPKDPAGRAEMRLWTKTVDEDVHPACAVVTFVTSHRHTVLDGGPENAEKFIEKAPDARQKDLRRAWLYQGFDAPGVAGAIATFDKRLQRMEDALAERTWLAGDDFTLADVGLIPYVNRLDMLSVGEIWASARPRVADWFDRVKARPSFDAGIFVHMPPNDRDEMLENGRRGGPELLSALRSP